MNENLTEKELHRLENMLRKYRDHVAVDNPLGGEVIELVRRWVREDIER